MRVLSVGVMGFFVAAVLLWLAGAFISGIWNPMLWLGIGRFTYVVMLFCVALPAGIGAGVSYDDAMKRGRR